MGTGTATISAGAAPAERTEQEQVRPAVPQTLMDQEVELACLTYAERKKKISRDKRLARYEHVLALHRAGMGQRAIARELQMSRRIVQRYLDPRRLPGTCSWLRTASAWQEQARSLSGVSPRMLERGRTFGLASVL